MKKLFSTIAILWVSVLSFSQETTANNNRVKWILDDQGVLTIKAQSVMEDYDKTKAPWYSFRQSITSVNIENGVTNIGSASFAECVNLKTVTIPGSVKTIGNRAFYNCKTISTINIPNSVTTIGAEAFGKCVNLTIAKLPNKLTEIPNGLFRGCRELQIFTIPTSIKKIGNYAFAQCNKILITIPKNVTEIGSYAFQDCHAIVNISIPEGVSTIERGTFYGCLLLEKVTISSSVKQINLNAFGKCPRLVDVYIKTESVPIVEGNPLGQNYKKMYIWVPAHRKRNYEFDKYWGKLQLSCEGEEKITPSGVYSAPKTAKQSKAKQSKAKPKTQSAYVVNVSSNLNVRSAANSTASVIGTVRDGDTVYVSNVVDTWGEITYRSQIGYVSMSFLKAVEINQKPQNINRKNDIASPVIASSTVVSRQESKKAQPQTQYKSQPKSQAQPQPTSEKLSFSSKNNGAEEKINTSSPSQTEHNGITLGFHADAAGIVAGFGEADNVGGGFGIDFEAGFVTGNELVFLGAGISSVNYFIQGNKTLNTTSYLPIYACNRIYFSSQSYAPYLDLALGGYVVLKNDLLPKDLDIDIPKGGLFFRAGLGYTFAPNNLYIYLSAGYELHYVKKDEYESTGHAIYFRIGIGTR